MLLNRATIAAALLLAACGGKSTPKLTYKGHVLDPKSVIWASHVEGNQTEALAVVSDQGGYCDQFEGLACGIAPFYGTTLIFQLPTLSTGDFSVGTAASAEWRDFTGGVETRDDASSGQLHLDTADAEGRMEGHFSLSLPGGKLEGDLGADFCPALRDYFLRCAH